MKALRSLTGFALMTLLASGAFAQTPGGPADAFGQPQVQVQSGPACPPVPAPRAERKRVTAIEAIKGGAEIGALLGGMSGYKKGTAIGTVAGGLAGLIWERTAKHPEVDAAPAPQ